MKLFLSIFLVLSLIPNNEEVMAWSAQNKLEWVHFKANSKPGADIAALTASGITFSFSVEESSERGYLSFDTTVEAHFYPEKSWYIKERANEHILAHEQLHFDLTELHVRKLRYQISKLKISSNIKKELNAIHGRVNLELAEMQNLYDFETDHSRNIEKQNNWSAFVENELIKFKEFASK